MSYSTGSGSYTDLMDAVLVHAVADGWTEAGGVDTGWPISKGDVRGVDWTSFTAEEGDVTVGGPGGTKTQRFIRIGIGITTAGATSNAATSTCHFPNAAYTFSEWYIFSDTSLCDYIHVVVKFSNGVNDDCYGHFSFGELDKSGMTYKSVAYATASGHRGYAEDNGANSIAGDWNSLNRARNGWSGEIGEDDDGTAVLSFITHGTDAPHSDGSDGWPSHDTLYEDGSKVWSKGYRLGVDVSEEPRGDGLGFAAFPINWCAWTARAPAQTGTITMMPIPFFFCNSSGSSGRLIYAGTFPDVRKTNVQDVDPGDEIVYGTETWKIFPILRKTSWDVLNNGSVVTSGYAGIAFKKVV